LAEKLDQPSDSDSGDETMKLLKEAIINCRQNEAYLRIVHVNSILRFHVFCAKNIAASDIVLMIMILFCL